MDNLQETLATTNIVEAVVLLEKGFSIADFSYEPTLEGGIHFTVTFQGSGLEVAHSAFLETPVRAFSRLATGFRSLAMLLEARRPPVSTEEAGECEAHVSDPFTQGIAWAIGFLNYYHDKETIARDMAYNAGIRSRAALRRAGVDQHDLDCIGALLPETE